MSGSNAPNGTHDALALLEHAHERLDLLLDTLVDLLVDAPHGPARPRREMLARIDHELRAQQQIEERTLYSRLDRRDTGVRQALAQHRHLVRMLEELRARDPTTREWERGAWSLRGYTELHFHLEENEVFEMARDSLDRSDADRLRAALFGRTPPRPLP